MQVCHLPLADQAYFLFDHLKGEPWEESPEVIIETLQEFYGCQQSYVALQETLFSRK